MNACPSDAQLAAYLEGAAGADAGRIAAHVRDCASCVRRVEQAQSAGQAAGNDPAAGASATSVSAAGEAEVGPLRTAPGPTASIPPRRGDSHSERIGPYRLLEPLGEGGMGTVYLAEQTAPIRRRVALKIIKLGMDTKAVIARFESERHALALMNHPNVAKVLDAGATEQGRPYFAMEHVKGEPITDYCDRQRLTTGQRLELFMAVCAGVQHAHQKGLIHRDIKPSNILVAVEGDAPVPKIIDFGVAKATEQKLTEKTLFTEQGQLIGTPEYMSPEQAEMTAVDIDTRTDIYSLGVVLYELLAGALPFDSAYLRRAAFGEVQRIIREVDPPKPSTRLSSLGDKGSTMAAGKRRTDRQALERQLRGDLDCITLKAIEKDRTRRYATALDLAADIQRHLDHEPVQARPPSAGDRAKKFLRRHRAPVAAAAGVFLALAVGLVVATAQYFRAERARANEQRQRQLAENLAEAEKLARRDAEDQRRIADDQRQRAEDLALAEQEQRQRAESLADSERLARDLADARYQEIVRLADIKRLADARAAAESLWPAHPDKIPAMLSWLTDQAYPLRDRLETHRATCASLREQAQPYDEDQQQRDRQTHPQAGELVEQQERLGKLEQELADARSAAANDIAAEESSTGTTTEGAGAAEQSDTDGGTASNGMAAGAAKTKETSEDDPDSHQTSGSDSADSAATEAAAESAAAEEAKREAAAKRAADLEESMGKTQQRIAELEGIVAARRTWTFNEAESQWQHDTLAELVTGLEAFADPDEKKGTLASVEARLEFAKTIDDRSVAGPDVGASWAAAIADIAELEVYGGLQLAPQLGLVPLRRDALSGLWEFWHVQTGDRPEPNPDSEAANSWLLTGDTGIVFVLVPGGTFWMGAQKERPQDPNYDAAATGNESPVHEVTLDPFFISKYEMTQGQWQRFTGSNPSQYGPDWSWNGEPPAAEPINQNTAWNPVEQVSWTDCDQVLGRLGLVLPSEAQWEYAARAGTSTPWWTGAEKESIGTALAGNLADGWMKSKGGPSAWLYEEWLEDGWAVHAPAGSFMRNPLGLHDTIGNVWEWCRDWFGDYATEMERGDGLRKVRGARARVARGGSFGNPAADARSAYRSNDAPESRNYGLGLRPSRVITP